MRRGRAAGPAHRAALSAHPRAQGKVLREQLRPLMQHVAQGLGNITQIELPHGVRLPAVFRQENPPRPGLALRARGLRPKHPVIIVPGFVTSGLELWRGAECAVKYFRRAAAGGQGGAPGAWRAGARGGGTPACRGPCFSRLGLRAGVRAQGDGRLRLDRRPRSPRAQAAHLGQHGDDAVAPGGQGLLAPGAPRARLGPPRARRPASSLNVAHVHSACSHRV